MKSIGEQIRESRKSKGLTQQQLATRCHLGFSTVQGIESGRATPTVDSLAAIVGVLGGVFVLSHEGWTVSLRKGQ